MSNTSEIHVRVVPGPEYVGELTGAKTTERFKERVQELGASIGEIANELRDRLDAVLEQKEESRWALGEVQLSFSLDLEAAAGVVVAKAKTSAGFEAQLTWQRRTAPTP